MPSETVTPTPTQDVGDRVARRRLVRNAVIAFIAVCAVLVTSYLVPVPTVASVRSWGEDLGPGFVWVFFLAYALVTVFPIPRTVFTVSAGVLFGPVVGLIGALISTAVAATLGFLLARWAGRDRVTPFLSRPVVMTIDARLAARGWLAIGSLRLIPICPFWLLNWCAGLSSVRLLPYLIASVIASAPGTVAVVLLGNALTGERNPLLMLLSATFFAVGVIGLIVDVRLPVRDQSTTA
ncbi:TVP38/TMEM64 family protein [Gordonia sp. w5E2]|uniref:TVP38/TMEM64 family membrane protein n=1 Tax=Gordonia jacobaea TaxID=122202 RepID=A0ABR5II49_9ACTN|nr:MULTISPECIES: TVP38/TMEM64 family protein [Gordonia]KNA93245.1 membrane protein [Gordonia jacobaea]